ncbi:MAG: LPS export ABC transporter periplasmic protein LptC [Polaromonas sp.]|nr:LPS export ABC transporter periplasmic protein LptC [Polaromonas sp.]
MRLWDQASIYLPLLLMGALALGTYWLVRNTPASNNIEVAKDVRHESDYFMRNFTVKSFGDNGQFKSEIYGVEARHYPDNDTLEIDQVRIRSVNAEGRLTTSTANRVLSNGDGSELQLSGNALVVREASKDANGTELPRMEFRGEFLHAFVNEERVKSHKPVVLTRGSDKFTGDTFTYDNLSGVAELKGRVKGVLMPNIARPNR